MGGWEVKGCAEACNQGDAAKGGKGKMEGTIERSIGGGCGGSMVAWERGYGHLEEDDGARRMLGKRDGREGDGAYFGGVDLALHFARAVGRKRRAVGFWGW
ncbi:hypothetical protein COCNU_01G007000 [Cocos nucifera]|uniref:Uncharacterized protein n=1 Tax=Cocos nucifera TaxID=13894 RepID=A0A8K0HU87_COCNU|nr:hypothetical protein COCNU_01G007000 [Cocos nucifera]